jgi:hypothetical protein
MRRVLKPEGRLCLLDIMFVSQSAQGEAARLIGRGWDSEEDYPQVGALDALLRGSGFMGILWAQTAPCHWAVSARANLNPS